MSRLLRAIFLYSFLVLMLTGCLSPVALNRAVEVYDAAAIQAESKQLLTNITTVPLTFKVETSEYQRRNSG